jgi:hypothetical protein
MGNLLLQRPPQFASGCFPFLLRDQRIDAVKAGAELLAPCARVGATERNTAQNQKRYSAELTQLHGHRVDYVEDTPEHAEAAAMFALKRKSGHAECSPQCGQWEMRMHTMLFAPRG